MRKFAAAIPLASVVGRLVGCSACVHVRPSVRVRVRALLRVRVCAWARGSNRKRAARYLID
jgi:hypothetical protein